ncbi:MAG: AAA family ATPase, partial [Alphaproteobacteria bacterium]|nr:AAA family ATPase [Alphaproteobacteria bacterium]
IDEVENHLHPSMQRQVLGDFLEAFPNVCFIVSTHSPLIVGSVIASRTSGLMKGLRFVPKASLIASHSSGSKRRFRALFTFSFLSFVRGFSLKGIPQSCMAISRACLMI